LIIPVSGCLSGDNSLKKKKKKRIPLISNQVLESVKEGDVLLRRAGGPFSEKIVEFLDEKYRFSHVGLAVELDGELTIIHSISEDFAGRDGVQTQTLRAFANDIGDSTFCIVRPKVTDEQKQQIITLAKNYLDEGVVFDYDYITDDSSKLYCSEFLYYTVGTVIGKEHFRFKEKGQVKIILFDSFLNKEFFEMIYCLRPLED
jgi:hypothetical protein